MSAADGYAPQMLSPAVDNLVAQLTRLPGIGSRTAQRLAFHLLQVPKEEAHALADAIDDVKERVRFCRECGNLTEEELCAICLDARRDHTIDLRRRAAGRPLSLERTAEFRGLYHVLGGALSPLDGVEPEHLRIDELLHRVERNGVQEVVLATNPNMTGEATAAYLADRLRGRVRVTRLASGLPVGGDLEYADEVTLGRALGPPRDGVSRSPNPLERLPARRRNPQGGTRMGITTSLLLLAVGAIVVAATTFNTIGWILRRRRRARDPALARSSGPPGRLRRPRGRPAHHRHRGITG